MSEIPDIQRYAKLLREIRGNKVRNMSFRAMREALAPIQKVAGAQYAQRQGKHDVGQSETARANRWGGQSVGASRRAIAMSIWRKPAKLKMIRGGAAFLGKFWGQTQNSWLVEFGRYKDAARSYRGWGTMADVWKQMNDYTIGVFKTVMEQEIKKLQEVMAKQLQRDDRRAKREALRAAKKAGG